MMEKVNYIIFMRHVPLVCSTAKLLGQIHKRKTLNIKQDMLVYGYRGLYDSIRKYDGKRLFVNYAKIYIKGSIYKCITDNYTISKIPITERRKSVMKRKPVYQEYENEYKHTTYLRGLDYLSCANNERCGELLYLWVEINRLDPFVKRLFYYRFDYMFNIKHTNKEVAELMCCSEEHVRQTIKKHIYVLIGSDASDLDNINGVKYIYK
jgi:RNA polymerase sigma factor (sigma-70 family)